MCLFLRCNAAFAILFCAEAAVPESIVRLYAVVSVTDLVIRPRGRKRGSVNFDLDRSKLRFASFTVDSPRFETQDEDKAVLRRHQKPSCGEKGDFPSVGTRGECRHSKQQRSRSTSDEQQRRSEDAGAVDAHQGENNAAGAVVEEFQFSRRYAVDLDLLSKSLQKNLLVDKHALQRASFAEDVHKVGQVWP